MMWVVTARRASTHMFADELSCQLSPKGVKSSASSLSAMHVPFSIPKYAPIVSHPLNACPDNIDGMISPNLCTVAGMSITVRSLMNP